MTNNILESLEFDSDISVPPCIWGRRYKGHHRDTDIEIDFIITYGAAGIEQQVSVHPDTYSWLILELDAEQYLPKVTTSDIQRCIVSRIAFLQELERYENGRSSESQT